MPTHDKAKGLQLIRQLFRQADEDTRDYRAQREAERIQPRVKNSRILQTSKPHLLASAASDKKVSGATIRVRYSGMTVYHVRSLINNENLLS